MSNFVAQFILKTEKFQEDVLNKRFEIARKIYNCLVTITQNRYKYYVQIVFKGTPPKKANRIYGDGDVGLDIGT